jgi:hypothetical protein
MIHISQVCKLENVSHSCNHQQVEELCAISEPLVKVLLLVDGEKPTMGYLYEAMDRANEAIHRYYEDKGEDGFTK